MCEDRPSVEYHGVTSSASTPVGKRRKTRAKGGTGKSLGVCNDVGQLQGEHGVTPGGLSRGGRQRLDMPQLSITETHPAYPCEDRCETADRS